MVKIASRKQLYWLVLFGVAMGFLEAAVVIYLRRIYYPGGFAFPLAVMDPQLTIVELFREASTVIMLAGVGFLSGRSGNQRLAFFLAAFSIWDIFYYVFLKLLIHWPESFFTWDILFLIPVPWIGPVLAPCLVSLTMLLLAAVMYFRDLQHTHRINGWEWSLFITGSLIVVFSWTRDYFQRSYGARSPEETLVVLSNYTPQSYPWWLFAAGEALLLSGIFLFWKRTKTHPPYPGHETI